MSKIDKEIIEELNTAVENTEKEVRMRQILRVANAYVSLQEKVEGYNTLIDEYDEDLVKTAEGLSEEQIEELRNSIIEKHSKPLFSQMYTGTCITTM